MEKCCNNQTSSSGKKLALGLLIISLGLIFLLDNFGLFPTPAKDIVFSWPMLIIGIGIINLFGRNTYFAGIVMIVVGLFFIIPKMFDFSFSFISLLWPVLLIVVGLLVIFRRGLQFKTKFEINTAEKTTMGSDSYIDEINVFGGSKQNILSKCFKGGKITCIFGGSELDFSQAKLAEGSNYIEMVCIFGGTSIIIPSHWKVRSEVVAVMGGFADNRRNIPPIENADSELVIKGVAIFGGGEIKNYKEL